MSGGVKGQPDEWILAVVQKYNSGSSKYVVLDVDAGDDPLGLSGGGAKQHTIPARYVIALPTSEPSHYSAYNEFKASRANSIGAPLWPHTSTSAGRLGDTVGPALTDAAPNSLVPLTAAPILSTSIAIGGLYRPRSIP
eukprot:scaffold25008_cov31-Tisochrysis_lutea.AAC.4